ncbi:protein FAM200A-like [Prorops nasuta]|uniref:protein FAM200A-like n=1 Tax=Prorops nasuta TaxID=863751 RepID=UPI0034CE594B
MESRIENKLKKGKFCQKWLHDERYKDWISIVPDDDYSYQCNKCNKQFSCEKTHVSKHKHKNNARLNDITNLCNNLVLTDNENEESSKKFRLSWLEKSEFKLWLRNIPNNDNYFYCRVCNVTCKSGLSNITEHARSKNHKSNLPENNMDNIENLEQTACSFDERKKSAEIRFAALMTEKNIPFNAANDILNFFKEIGKDSNVLQSMRMNRTKCTKIISNVLCPIETESIAENIKENNFSVFIDETSDITNKKWMTFFVRYVDSTTLDVQCTLLKLIDIDAKDCCAEKLFDYFEKEMLRMGISFSNIIGLACDNASVMIGKHSSFKTKLEAKCKNLKTFPCICHSLALAANAACSKIPDFCEDFMKKISTYVNSSPKRSAIYEEFSTAFQEKNKKILKLCDTRWLCRYQCIERILTSWNSIVNFLREMVVSENSKTAQDLLSTVENVDTKAYFLFLKFVLNYFNSFSAYFQTRETRVHLIYDKSVQLLKDLCINYLKTPLINYLTDNIRLSDEHNIKNIEEIYLGPDCEKYLTELEKEGRKDIVIDVRKHCLQFYLTAAKEIKKRLPFNDEFLKNLRVLKADIALQQCDREKSFDDISLIAKSLGDYDETKLKEEWVSLYNKITDEEKVKLSQLNFDDMWKNILKIDINGSKNWPNLSKLLSKVRCLPHSNADPERTFSVLSDLKTRKRNRLSADSVNSACVFKSALKAKKRKAIDIELSDKHIALMDSKNLYKASERIIKNALTINPIDDNNEDADDPDDTINNK